jgi:hypothetical protein
MILPPARHLRKQRLKVRHELNIDSTILAIPLRIQHLHNSASFQSATVQTPLAALLDSLVFPPFLPALLQPSQTFAFANFVALSAGHPELALGAAQPGEGFAGATSELCIDGKEPDGFASGGSFEIIRVADQILVDFPRRTSC